MSELAEPPVRTAPEASAGQLLRRGREATGLHVAALAVSLKVPVRKLEALEDDRYEDLGDPVFIRALASSVCRSLKIDPQPILDRLPQTAAPRLVRDLDGINTPFRAPGDGPAPSWLDALRQPVPLVVLALVIGAVVLWFFPVSRLDGAVVIQAPAQPAVQPAPALAQPAAMPAEAASAIPVAAAVPTAAASAPTAQVAATAAPPAEGIVVLRTRGESWVEVVDAKGVVALRKLMAAGESAGAGGAVPLTVTIGKADVTDVEVRGQKFDLKSVSKDNVARFDVK